MFKPSSTLISRFLIRDDMNIDGSMTKLLSWQTLLRPAAPRPPFLATCLRRQQQPSEGEMTSCEAPSYRLHKPQPCCHQLLLLLTSGASNEAMKFSNALREGSLQLYCWPTLAAAGDDKREQSGWRIGSRSYQQLQPRCSRKISSEEFSTIPNKVKVSF